MWNLPDAELLALAAAEIEVVGLARREEIEDGCVFRVPKAYPLYDASYARHLEVLRGFLDGLPNLQMVGRNGLHRYNNQDHSMLTGLYAVRNALQGDHAQDIWHVNTEPEYLEDRAGEALPREGPALGWTGLLRRRPGAA